MNARRCTAGDDAGGPLYSYTVRDYLGRCLTVKSSPEAGVWLLPCDNTPQQEIALMQNSLTDR
jgi:hypothetical protein